MKNFFIFFIFLLFAVFTYSYDYIFLFIADGMGIPHMQLANLYKQYSYQEELNMFKVPYFSLVDTSSLNGVTDSAAAITAILSKEKTYNDRINIDRNGKKLFPITYDLKNLGYQIGVITTNTIIDATPAGAYASTINRRNYDNIKQDLLNSGFDLFIGGGKPYFDKNIASQFGYTYSEELKDHVTKNKEIVMLYYGNFPFLTDDFNRISLKDTLEYALKKFEDEPFFIIIEGGRIDHAAHAHDTISMIYEIWDFDDAIKVGLDFLNQNPEDTLIIVTADHSTGGLSLGDGFISTSKIPNNDFSYEKLINIFNRYDNYEEFKKTLNLKIDLEAPFYNTKNSEDSVTYQSELIKAFYDIQNQASGLNWGTFGHTLDYAPFFSNIPTESWLLLNSEIFSIFEISSSKFE
jgi:alkaline phosphatase